MTWLPDTSHPVLGRLFALVLLPFVFVLDNGFVTWVSPDTNVDHLGQEAYGSILIDSVPAFTMIRDVVHGMSEPGGLPAGIRELPGRHHGFGLWRPGLPTLLGSRP
ncbi:hypothetical protein ACH9EU_00120 [Kocuria sp. M1R5S2]|uniref:hypothetical protein n=1 Tax=Kocuria rhizosphaerae TaxID=3376285 RepID=UPI003795FD2C